jgi:hypothetical protein
VSCLPLTRDTRNPNNFELNDVLGNYSLTLIDSLSTLAILASSAPDRSSIGAKALRDFQDGVSSLVLQYGDGTSGATGKGLRARGFDVDSKVQVFETVIRGVGGLLSAHLFASGELPINGYKPQLVKMTFKNRDPKSKPIGVETPSIAWPNGFRYNGQLLRLALDLAQRLLPAFYTATGMPYPRVNLRHGIPFYHNSPLNEGSDSGDFNLGGKPEITETCSAGAGSLVLEFTVLSRLTGDPRFEQLAKRAFWAVWGRRSAISLIGAGVDAENGEWIGPYSGIGAGSDSFFEYALKTSILLSGHETPNLTAPYKQPPGSWLDPNTIHAPLSIEENSAEAFLDAWYEAHAAIKRHLYSGTHHPHYVNVHLVTGSPQAFWIDSLGAYYPGLLTLAGELEEAIETNMLYTALWTRYAALPERWSVRDGQVEGGLGWWPGRPEFIESNYHLYRATRDPWYLHVGEMVLKDIKRRCWTECGWSGLQDVSTGEKSDRMESFFLGETAKYLYLLFGPDHPLNSLDAAYVFTTEGHPLLIPMEKSPRVIPKKPVATKDISAYTGERDTDQCPAPPAAVPFTISATAARPDIFHASSLIGLHLIPNSRSIEAGMLKKGSYASELQAFPNHTYYPWTLPAALIPVNGTCDKLPMKTTFSIEFPINAPSLTADSSNFVVFTPQAITRLDDGLLVRSLSGLKLGMVYESPSPFWAVDGQIMESWRVWTIANVALGRDEKILLPRGLVGELNDPAFSRVRDSVMLDIVLQLDTPVKTNQTSFGDTENLYSASSDEGNNGPQVAFDSALSKAASSLAGEYRGMLSSLIHQVTSVLRDPATTFVPQPVVPPSYPFAMLPGIAPTGRGAAPILDVVEAPDPRDGPKSDRLTWSTIFFAGEACTSKLPDEAARRHEVIVILRGGCSFSDKLANIPSYTPTSQSLKLVIVVSDSHDDMNDAEEESWGMGFGLIRPLLDREQRTPAGLLRHHQISMVMVGGGHTTVELLKKSRSVGLRRRYHIESKGLVVGNIIVV